MVLIKMNTKIFICSSCNKEYKRESYYNKHISLCNKKKLAIETFNVIDIKPTKKIVTLSESSFNIIYI